MQAMLVGKTHGTVNLVGNLGHHAGRLAHTGLRGGDFHALARRP